MENRPEGREKHVTGEGKSVARRGEALNTGKVGNSRPEGGAIGASSSSGGVKTSSTGSSGTKAGGSTGTNVVLNPAKMKLIIGIAVVAIIFIVVICLLSGGGLSGLLQLANSSGIADSMGNYGGEQSAEWSMDDNTGELDTSVAKNTRDKRTVIKGNGEDTVTIMVYMCGTDLESRCGMASSDLTEMMNANIDNSKMNIIVYTGGCNQWKIGSISNTNNQIYQIKDGKLECIYANAGTAAMTNPDNLRDFIIWCHDKFPADREELILWDHGGGSVSGYGYDEKNASAGSMDLAKLDKALEEAGVKFDFIGFDACLMATLETGLMLDDYADYLIASEETEPGIGWYYTNWLTEFSNNTSMPTIDVGQKIADDFVSECGKSCKGQKTTLSVVDLAELSATVPDKFRDFATSVSGLIENDNYKTVSDARYNTREFAVSSKIDQVDLVHLALNVNNTEGKELADAILGAVKYNKTSANMTNAYGISVYFPYRKVKNVDNAVATYNQIGVDKKYTKCIQQFASLETTGQSQSYTSSTSLLGSLLGGGSSQGFNLDLSSLGFLAENLLDNKSMDTYVAANKFDAESLKWQEKDGKHILSLPEEQWKLVQSITLNVFYDDGSGYIDLGTDNVFTFDDDGNLVGDTDGTWIAVNGQPVAYYYDDTIKDGDNSIIQGHIPAIINGDRVELIVIFDNDNPNGYIAGARRVYTDGETDTVAKAQIELNTGDTIDFICDYYDYEGNYSNSYMLGESMEISANMEISNVKLEDAPLSVMYKFTDIYNQSYWTEAIIEQ